MIQLIDLGAEYIALKKEIDESVTGVLAGGRYILGENVKALENEISQFVGTKYAVGVASGTDALLLSLIAVGVGKDDEVITTPFTFISTAEVIARIGARPVFVDIDEKTFNIDVSQIEQKISSRTKAIIPVHLYGQSAQMDRILDISRKQRIKIVEDACQALGAEYLTADGIKKKCGSIGDIGCLSFFPTKNLGACGDGGMILTDSQEASENIRMLRTHGSRRKYFHEAHGFNSRLDEIQAAILRVKFKYLTEWNEKRRRNAERYNELFGMKSPDSVVTPFVSRNCTHVYHQYTIRIKNHDKVQSCLKEKGIATAVHYPIPLHLQPIFVDLGYKKGDFPVSEKVSEEVLSLPVHPYLSQQDITSVVDALGEALVNE